MSKELFVRREDDFKRVAYLAKEFLKDSKDLKIISSHQSSATIAKVCSFLEEKGFVSITNVETKTEVRKFERDGEQTSRRLLNFIMTVTKTNNFDKLYEEYQKEKEEKIKQREAERAEKK